MDERLKLIAEQKKNPLPTPPVGQPVQWYENNDRANPRAAIVTKVEDPGKLTLTIFPPAGMPRHKQGVLHASHEIHQKNGHPLTRQNGSWDYPAGYRPPKEHYQVHLDYLQRREDAVVAEELKKEAEAEAIRLRKEENQRELAGAK